LRVTGVGCDVLHLYWKGRTLSFDDWREAPEEAGGSVGG
jgi:hypothetical protein